MLMGKVNGGRGYAKKGLRRNRREAVMGNSNVRKDRIGSERGRADFDEGV